ncbi:MAG: response regulator, partial [Gemmatimonadota bacterium]
MKEREGVILIVDDDLDVVQMLTRALEHRGFRIESTDSPDEALSRSEKTSYDAALVDLVMPGRDGVDLAA